MSAKLRQSPDFTKGLRDVLALRALKPRFYTEPVKHRTKLKLLQCHKSRRNMQKESHTKPNATTQTRNLTTPNALLARAERYLSIFDRERKLVRS